MAATMTETATMTEIIRSIEHIVGFEPAEGTSGRWSTELETHIITYLDLHYKLDEFKTELLSTKDPRNPAEIDEHRAIESLPSDPQELLNAWDSSACAALGYYDGDLNIEKLDSFRLFLSAGAVPAEQVVDRDWNRNDDGVGSFLEYLSSPAHNSLPRNIEIIAGPVPSVEYHGRQADITTYRHAESGENLRIVEADAAVIEFWQQTMARSFATALSELSAWKHVRLIANSIEFNEDDEDKVAKFIDDLMYEFSNIEDSRHTLFFDGNSLKSVFVELYRKIDDLFVRHSSSSIVHFHNHADYFGQNETVMNAAYDLYQDSKDTNFNDVVNEFVNGNELSEMLTRYIERATALLINESVGGLSADDGASVASSNNSSPGQAAQGRAAPNAQVVQGATNNAASAGDTGDMSSWDLSKGGLTASQEFNDPDSSLYKYVAYYNNNTKEVDHFLVTFDQNVDQHYSTNKTLRWNDTRQTRRQAYNILICSNKVSNDFSLLPWPGSDAACANREQGTVPVGIEVVEDTPQQSCVVSSRFLRGRKRIELDFSECPVTADTLPSGSNIAAIGTGESKFIIGLNEKDDPGPYFKEDISFLRIGSHKYGQDEATNFNEYFNYIQKLMRYVRRNGYIIIGDLDSFPGFSSGANESVQESVLYSHLSESIDEVINMIISERSSAGIYVSGRGSGGRGSRGGTSRFNSSGGSNYGSSRPGSGYTGAMVTVSGGLKYLGDPNIGLSPSDFWKNLRDDLQTYMERHYQELKLITRNLGVTRDLSAANNPSSSARVRGSKHGAGLATDIYLDVKDHPYTNFRVDNPRLAEDEKLVRLMRRFAATQDGVVWGGDFGGGSGNTVAAEGIVEFHHFEIEDNRMPSYFSQFSDEIEALDGNITVASLTSTEALATLYSKLA